MTTLTTLTTPAPAFGAPTPTLLEQKLALIGPLLGRQGRTIWDPVGLAERYPEYLVTMHGIIRASVPLMSTALDALGEHGYGSEMDPYRDYLEQHIMEETDHDEWCLQDLDALGVGRAAALDRLPTPAVAAHVGTQYYWILHTHPVCLLGHMAVMEAFPPSPATVELLGSALGNPSALRCVAHHAEADPTHSREILDLVESLRLAPRLESLVGLSALTTAKTVSGALAGLPGVGPG
jgi:hypothetical protein